MTSQAARQAQLHDLFRTHYGDVFDDQGLCRVPALTDRRAYLWASGILLGGDARLAARAHAMLRQALGHGRGHFWTSAIASILTHHGPRIEDGLRRQLTDALAAELPREAGQRCRGYNDNYPAMATCACVLGGELVGDRAAVAAGRETLRSFRDLLRRRGVLSEHTSPTYTPITLTCLAEIAEHAADPECRSLALAAEQTVWRDLLAHFHPVTGVVAGPYSRAYLTDLCGHFHNAHVVLWLVLGDAVVASPGRVALPWDARMVAHNGTPAFPQAHIGWQSLATYHPPEDAERLALVKADGTCVRATGEQASFPRNFWSLQLHPATPTMEFPAGPFATTTWLRRSFALGTASATFLDGNQHSGCHAVYAPAGRATGAHDLATLFPRYLIGDTVIDASAMINDLGRSVAVQDRGRALVAAWPRPAWGSNPASPDTATTPVGTLRLALFVTCFHGDAQEVWLGGRCVDGWTGSSVAPEPVFIRDGRVFIAIHPAIGSDLGRPAAVTLERRGPFAVISLVNYQGEPRCFKPEELLACANGFHLAIADADDHGGSFEAFRASYAGVAVADRTVADDGLRYLQADHAGHRLELCISPMSAGVQYRLVDGELAAEPRWAVG